MADFAAPTQRFFALATALCIALVIVLSGCSANSIAGPDLAPDDTTVETSRSYAPNAHHNEGVSKDSGDEGSEGTEPRDDEGGAPHNEG